MTELPEIPQPTIDAIWAAREAEAAMRPQYDGFGISASALGSLCDRSLWYGLRWASPPEKLTGRKLRIFERGNIEEQRVIDDLRRAGLDVLDRDPDTNKQWVIKMANGWLRGKTDGKASGFKEAPKADHVIEIKSLKAADWRGIVKHGLLKHKPEHWHQLHAGMIGLGVDRGAYIGVNKDTEELWIERVHLNVEEGNIQEARVIRIVADQDGPARAADKPESFVCRFCNHKALCHGESIHARRSCRTCIHFTFGDDGNGHCERFEEPRTPFQQKDGATCPAHLFLPALVNGDQIDANPDLETITYQLPDGSTWIDGAQKEAAE